MGKLFKKYITVKGAIAKNDKPIEMKHSSSKRKASNFDEQDDNSFEEIK